MMKKILLPLLIIAPITSYAQSPSNQANKEEIIYMDIAAKTKTCDAGVLRMQCLQTKTFSYDKKGKKVYKNTKWQYFYDNIEGYSHVEGKPSTLKVKVIHLPKEPYVADKSTTDYILIKKL